MASRSFFRLWPIALAISIFSTIASAAVSTRANILVIAKDELTAKSAHFGLQAYGIPYRVLIVPQAGLALPVLNSSATVGNYGGFVIVGDVSYKYNESVPFRSALTSAQWQSLYDYQKDFKVRMIRIDVYPEPQFGTTPVINGTGCCQPGVTQQVMISNNTGFPTAQIKTMEGLPTEGLFHVPAKITDPKTTWEFARFDAAGQWKEPSTAGVINDFGTRQQMVFFITWGSDWSITSTFLQHAWVNWLTRGLYVGFRRTYFSTQIDDMFLVTDLYQPAGSTFRIRPADLEGHITWQKDINSRLPRGSMFMLETGHNGNGDIEAAVALSTNGQCNPIEAIEYPDQIDTVLEFRKVPGTGTDVWPATPVTYQWTVPCENLDPLMRWWRQPAKRDAFMHLSHTFSHEALNNATYADGSKEISFNKVWLQHSGISSAKHFSASGLIPPAITGMHNADVIKAWMDNGIKFVVGDNTRPPLADARNPWWPLISNNEVNGYPGLVIMPRWATTIYYNCDLPECTLNEWTATSGGSGDFQHLLDDARRVNAWHLLGLHWDPFMFHQANLRMADVPEVPVNGVMKKLSLLAIWTEVVLQEMVRLTNWPLITIKHDDLGVAFVNRMTRDQCSPYLVLNHSEDGGSVVSVTVNTNINGNKCSTPLPITVPNGVGAIPKGATREQVGSDPLTVWVKLTGQPVTIQLNPPMKI
ncbi:hypothetical protein Vi05172_g3830 [Venturia inaequalis]|uniref:Extracellular serine-rich protein n=1 Tax=Venturia inaequalis TaxID=5025 RepID=A0A8H3UY04_VENIN|nr:hypothetical protein EG327_007317 [Venturia inaequalis]RDI86196.1 hypothetical protein Vi05172_g3830 [Venturia inaequalis]